MLSVMALTISFGVNTFLGVSAQAARPAEASKDRKVQLQGKSEVFSSKDAPSHKRVQATKEVNAVAAAGAYAFQSEDSPAKRWFEAVDQIVVAYEKSEKENIVLRRDFNQEVERVQEWTKTAKGVAYKYRRIAGKLQQLQVPEGSDDLAEYGKLLADYYNDSAQIYEDLTRARAPAQTIDELEDQLEMIASRAKGIKRMRQSLEHMDDSLRGKYRVHKRFDSDALYKYIFGKH